MARICAERAAPVFDLSAQTIRAAGRHDMPTTKPRQPQDHKPKAKPVAEAGFTFDHKGQTYTLPAPSAALAKLPGRAFRDGMIGGEEGEIRFALQCVEAVGADDAALDALYDKPTDEMLTTLGKWMQSADLSGATLPQS